MISGQIFYMIDSESEAKSFSCVQSWGINPRIRIFVHHSHVALNVLSGWLVVQLSHFPVCFFQNMGDFILCEVSGMVLVE